MSSMVLYVAEVHGGGGVLACALTHPHLSLNSNTSVFGVVPRVVPLGMVTMSPVEIFTDPL
jgi:hypothetical protein